MTERLVELQAALSEVRRRWTRQRRLRAWMFGAAACTTVLLAGVGAVLVAAREGLPLVITVGIVTAVAAVVLARTLWPLRRHPHDGQIARLVEERAGDLDDVVVTAVDYAARPDASPAMREVLAADATRAVRSVELDRIVSPTLLRKALLGAAAATAALVVAAALFAPSFTRAANISAAYLFPARFALDVTPGSIKVRSGQPVTITARISGLDEGLTPALLARVGDETRELRMIPTGDAGVYGVTIEQVGTSFGYSVAAGNTRSATYDVTVIHPPRVERIDLRYEFPRGLGLEPRTDEDSGDIYGPPGTKVRLSITTDKPIAKGFLTLDDGTRVQLNGQSQVLEGELTIQDDGSYRVALADTDGLDSAGDTEYFIRTLDDRPPDVRILRPASDKQVTPIEEVAIEARADDDYGIAAFDLVFQSPGGKEKVVPFKGTTGGLTANGLHTLFLEDLQVKPGDFVAYYARARDVNRGRRSAEARSDIFFLEVKPFEEEFVAAQSQAMGSGASPDSMQGLAEAQKEIIVATWKLDARARRARDAKPAEDIKAVAQAQAELKTRAERQAGSRGRAIGDPRRRPGAGGAPPNEDPVGRAVEAMGRAVGTLEKLDTSAALPHEMEALNELLKAEAEVRRRQVAQQQQAGGGGGMNRSQADLSSLFDQELRKRQQTNYETPNTTEEREETTKDDPLEKIRELARRQDALNRQQRDLARNREQLEQDEIKRMLERLTREQNQLRQQAEQLSRQMSQQAQGQRQQQGQPQQSSSASGQQQQSGQGSQNGRQLREISEEMRNAATNLGRQNPEQASASGDRAAERLRDLERQLQSSEPDGRRRALGDLQMETRQLADAQRRLAGEAGRTAQGQSGADARRRLAGEQERLAERTQRLEENVRRLSRSGGTDQDDKRATEEAARELERQKLGERMRAQADALRTGAGATANEQQKAGDAAKQVARQGEDVARSLDRIADRLGAAAGQQNADSQRLSDQLARTQELRDRVAEIDRAIEQLQREGQQSQQAQQGDQNGRQQGQQPGQQGQQGQQGQRAQGGQQPGGNQAGQSGDGGGGEGGRGRLEQLQREVNQRGQDLQRMAEAVQRETGGNGASTPESWWRSFSAPGTEAFKNDYAKWESLKKNLLVALENVESKLSDQLRAAENKERLNSGGHQSVSEQYRALVEKYYRSLAAPRKR